MLPDRVSFTLSPNLGGAIVQDVKLRTADSPALTSNLRGVADSATPTSSCTVSFRPTLRNPIESTVPPKGAEEMDVDPISINGAGSRFAKVGYATLSSSSVPLKVNIVVMPLMIIVTGEANGVVPTPKASYVKEP